MSDYLHFGHAFVLFLCHLVFTLVLWCFAGKAVDYRGNIEHYGRRLGNGAESTTDSHVIATSPYGVQEPRDAAQQEDETSGDDLEFDQEGDSAEAANPGRPYNPAPAVYAQQGPPPRRFRQKDHHRGKLSSPRPHSQAQVENDSDSRYPSMMPQIAKVIYGSGGQSSHATTSSSVDAALQQEHPPVGSSYGRQQHYPTYGQTPATTPRTFTEASVKNYLSRPRQTEYDDYTTPKSSRASPSPQMHNKYNPKYETNIEKPPQHPPSRGAGQVMTYSYFGKPGDKSLPETPNFRHLSGLPPPQTPSTTSIGSENYGRDSQEEGEHQGDQGEHDGEHEQNEVREEPRSSLKYRHHQHSQPRIESHYRPSLPVSDSPPSMAKFDSKNSVKTGTNSFMTLSFEPVSESHKTRIKQAVAVRERAYSSQQPSESYSKNNQNQDVEDHFTKNVFYKPQTRGNVIEDQQEAPSHRAQAIKFNYRDTYARPGLHEAPLLPENGPTQQNSRPYYGGYSQAASTRSLSSYATQPPPKGNHQQSPLTPTEKPHSQVKVTYYRTFHRTKEPDQNSHPQSPLTAPRESKRGHQEFPYPPLESQAPSQPTKPEEGQASEVEQKFDFSGSIEKYAKEFGFEMPSASKPEPTRVVSRRQAASHPRSSSSHPNHLFSSPAEHPFAGRPQSNLPSKNAMDTHFYRNMIYPEFAPEFKEYQQSYHGTTGLSQIQDLLNAPSAGTVGQRPESENEADGEMPANIDKDLASVLSFAKSFVTEEAASSDPKGPKKNPGDENKVTKADVDDIISKFAQVVSEGTKQESAAAAAAASVGTSAKLNSAGTTGAHGSHH